MRKTIYYTVGRMCNELALTLLLQLFLSSWCIFRATASSNRTTADLSADLFDWRPRKRANSNHHHYNNVRDLEHFELVSERDAKYYATMNFPDVLTTRSWWTPRFLARLFSVNSNRAEGSQNHVYFLGIPWMYSACDAYITHEGVYEALGDMNNLISNISTLKMGVRDHRRLRRTQEGLVRVIFGRRFTKLMNDVNVPAALYIQSNRRSSQLQPIRNICVTCFLERMSGRQFEYYPSLYEAFLIDKVLPLVDIEQRVNVFIGGGDPPVPHDVLVQLVANPRVSRIFLENSPVEHPKVLGVPVGLSGHSLMALGDSIKQSELLPWSQRLDSLLVGGFTNGSSLERKKWLDFANDRCTVCYTPKSYKELVSSNAFWGTLTKYKFVLSPPGMGWDCHRTTEILLLGSVPVIPYYAGVLSAYEGLPVVVVRSVNDVTYESMERWKKSKLGRMVQNRTMIRERLSTSFWVEKLRASYPPVEQDRIRIKQIKEEAKKKQYLTIVPVSAPSLSTYSTASARTSVDNAYDSGGKYRYPYPVYNDTNVTLPLLWWKKYYYVNCNITYAKLCNFQWS